MDIYGKIGDGGSYSGWWFGTCFIPSIGNVIIPSDQDIFQMGRYTTNQSYVLVYPLVNQHNYGKVSILSG